MKKAILIFVAAVTIASCSNGSNGSTNGSTNDSTMVCDSTMHCDSIPADTLLTDTVSK